MHVTYYYNGKIIIVPLLIDVGNIECVRHFIVHTTRQIRSMHDAWPGTFYCCYFKKSYFHVLWCLAKTSSTDIASTLPLLHASTRESASFAQRASIFEPGLSRLQSSFSATFARSSALSSKAWSTKYTRQKNMYNVLDLSCKIPGHKKRCRTENWYEPETQWPHFIDRPNSGECRVAGNG